MVKRESKQRALFIVLNMRVARRSAKYKDESVPPSQPIFTSSLVHTNNFAILSASQLFVAHETLTMRTYLSQTLTHSLHSELSMNNDHVIRARLQASQRARNARSWRRPLSESAHPTHAMLVKKGRSRLVHPQRARFPLYVWPQQVEEVDSWTANVRSLCEYIRLSVTVTCTDCVPRSDPQTRICTASQPAGLPTTTPEYTAAVLPCQREDTDRTPPSMLVVLSPHSLLPQNDVQGPVE